MGTRFNVYVWGQDEISPISVLVLDSKFDEGDVLDAKLEYYELYQDVFEDFTQEEWLSEWRLVGQTDLQRIKTISEV